MDVSPDDGGSVKVNQVQQDGYPAISVFASGASVILEAVPADGYYFTGWSGSLSGKNNPATIRLDCSERVIANFSPVGASSQSGFHWWYILIAAAVVLIIGVPVWLIIKKRIA